MNTKVETSKREALAKKKRGDKTGQLACDIASLLFFVYAYCYRALYVAGALIALKKSNRYQEETKKLQGTIMNLENQKMMLESATVNVEVIKVLDHTNKALGAIHKDVYVCKCYTPVLKLVLHFLCCKKSVFL